jgi:hypothetical protein
MQRGYIKVWRKTIDSGWLQNHKLCAFWLWCLLKASHKEYDLIVGCQKVHLMPGDFVFGLNKASEELAMSIRSIRTILAFLKTSQNLTIKTTNKFSVISIVNWDIYQQTETTNDNQNDKPPTSYRQATDNKQTHKHKSTKEYTSDFLQFYDAYPKHIGREPAWKAWQKLNGSRPNLSTLITKINEMKKSEDWTKDNGKFIPHPATWLNQKRWEDEGVRLEVKPSW